MVAVVKNCLMRFEPRTLSHDFALLPPRQPNQTSVVTSKSEIVDFCDICDHSAKRFYLNSDALQDLQNKQTLKNCRNLPFMAKYSIFFCYFRLV